MPALLAVKMLFVMVNVPPVLEITPPEPPMSPELLTTLPEKVLCMRSVLKLFDPELVKAQTELARLRFEDWLLSFLIFLPPRLKKIGRHSSSHNNDRPTQETPLPRLECGPLGKHTAR